MEVRPPRQKPHLRGIHGPIPPRHTRERAGQMVWPRDKKRNSWGRLRDILTGKGPDIWCTRQGSLAPHRPIWSNWRAQRNDPLHAWDNLGYLYENDEGGPHWFGAERPNNVKYDFKKRRYRVPDGEAWSDVKYDRNNRSIYYRTGLLGRHIVQDTYIDPLKPQVNPFGYDRGAVNDWDWDEVEFP